MKKTGCYWTGWENEYDKELNYVAPAGKVINGVNSIHKNKHEDRIFKYQVCDAKIEVLNVCVSIT